LSPSREEYETDKGLQEGERYKAKEEEERKKNAGIYQGITTTSPSQQPQSQASPILSSQSSQNHGHSTNQVLNPPPAPDAQTKLPYQIDGVTREQAAMAATAAASGQPYPYKPGEGGLPQTKTSLAQRSKYQFEADSSDDEIENEINEHLAILGQQAGRLNALARATDQEIDDQNKHIDRIIRKVSSPLFPWVMTAVLTSYAERSCGPPNRNEQSQTRSNRSGWEIEPVGNTQREGG
jgi:hypothetical protein